MHGVNKIRVASDRVRYWSFVKIVQDFKDKLKQSVLEQASCNDWTRKSLFME
jgi:hypothetical protein